MRQVTDVKDGDKRYESKAVSTSCTHVQGVVIMLVAII